MNDLEFSDEFSIRLKIAMVKRHVKSTAIANELHVSRQQAFNYVSGRQLPPLHNLARIAKMLDVTTDYLLGLED